MKLKFLKAKIAGVAAVLLFSLSISAIPISGPTTGPTGNMQEIDGIYWAQPRLFTNLSWTDIDTECPSGVCASSATLKNYDMTGWHWASTADMNGMFNYLISQEIALGSQGITFSEENNFEIQKLVTVFGYTDNNSTRYGYDQLFGLTSSLYEADNTQGTISRYVDWCQYDGACGQKDLVVTGKKISMTTKSNSYAAWFYYGDVSPSGIAPPSVPEPSTLAIFAIGLMGIAVRRFNKQA
ncbi:MAG: hypothetical protein ACJA13_000292 [Paraglaciecola sp.]|jgi:hypothetical protein